MGWITAVLAQLSSFELPFGSKPDPWISSAFVIRTLCTAKMIVSRVSKRNDHYLLRVARRLEWVLQQRNRPSFHSSPGEKQYVWMGSTTTTAFLNLQRAWESIHDVNTLPHSVISHVPHIRRAISLI
mgnify:CR=1 FL=1